MQSLSCEIGEFFKPLLAFDPVDESFECQAVSVDGAGAVVFDVEPIQAGAEVFP